MGFKEYISKLKNDYVINKVKRINIPDFDHSHMVRKKLIFIGKVQKVGFRLEFYELAKRLKLSGWVKNLENGNVEAEIQGHKDKIVFLIENMKVLKRARVDDVEKEDLKILENEAEFIIKNRRNGFV